MGDVMQSDKKVSIVNFDGRILVVDCEKLIELLNAKGDEERLTAAVIRDLMNEINRLRRFVDELTPSDI